MEPPFQEFFIFTTLFMIVALFVIFVLGLLVTLLYYQAQNNSYGGYQPKQDKPIGKPPNCSSNVKKP